MTCLDEIIMMKTSVEITKYAHKLFDGDQLKTYSTRTIFII